MSRDETFPTFGLASAPDDGVLVRFPPGLGLIPPRDVPHHPRVRGRSAAGVSA